MLCRMGRFERVYVCACERYPTRGRALSNMDFKT